jgi:diaminopimelate epimerase
MIPHVHECCVCKMQWSCDGVGRGKTCEVIKAVKVNKDGPYCNMCRNGIMFLRYAHMQGVDAPVMLMVLRKHEQRG